ncbi:MAG: siphovirus Gp157 family protein, partial [Pseudomonas sp.]|nr:siphovirus Gp157 family protein [Pseudomonas sp.]
MTTTTIAVPRDVPDGYMPIPTAEQIADALENVRCYHDMSAELIAPELLANLLAVTTVKESLSVAHSLPAAGSAVEEVEFVAWRYGFSGGVVRDSAMPDDWRRSGEYEPLMTVAQHERISDRRKALEKRAENMREYLRTNMEKAGISEIKALDGS